MYLPVARLVLEDHPHARCQASHGIDVLPEGVRLSELVPLTLSGCALGVPNHEELHFPVVPRENKRGEAVSNVGARERAQASHKAHRNAVADTLLLLLLLLLLEEGRKWAPLVVGPL